VSTHFTEAYNVSTAHNIPACRRSVFTILPTLNDNVTRQGDIVRYGDKVLIIADIKLTNNKRMHLNSGPLTYNR